MTDGILGTVLGAILATLICINLMADKTDSADKFAIDYQANEFSQRLGFTRHVCTIREKSYPNPCYGLLGKGMVVEFQCDLSKELNMCELVRQ